MKLLKPNWVHHDDKPIFSLDVHQECLKFATGGQGLDSGRVVIWNLLPVISEKAELDDSVPKMLCQMDNHLACVNSVRWSQNGQMLASGSDDKLVMIWRLSKGASGVFGCSGMQKNAESWRCVSTLRGHSGDVLDLAWSPQDRWLASCSIDNTIIVWDVQAFPAMIAMLKGHTGLVKGVTWDPVGKFLASQSDDRSVKIWKTSDWTCSKTITEPFEECGGTTHILRLSWSPDGQYLVSAHAMNGGGPTAQIIEREGWKCDKDFVGHRKAVTCVRFHNSILKRQATKTNKSQQYCCLAVGSRDRSLSVWMTALQRPLVVVHDLFNDSVLDLSWGPQKCILMACSGDGTVACLQFGETELGEQLSPDEKNSLYQRIYGKSAIVENGSNSVSDMVIENPDLLNTSQEMPKPPTLPPMMTSLTCITANNTAVESKNVSALSTASNGFSAQALTSPGSNFFPSASNSCSASSQALGKQVETRTADGKRRIVPLFIPPNAEGSGERGSAMPPPLTSVDCPVTVTETNTVTTAPIPDKEGSLFGLPTAVTEAEQIRLDVRLTKCPPGTTPPVPPPCQISRESVASFPAMSKFPPSTQTVSNPLQTVPYSASTTGPKIAINASTKCEFQKTALNHRVHVANGCVQTASGLLAKVTAYAMVVGEKLWEMFVGSPIVNLNFCQDYVMLCSLDGTIRLVHMYTGRPVLPTIALSSPAIQCAFCPRGKLVGVVSDCGLLRIWNIEKRNVQLATACTEIFGKHGQVAQFTISEHGVPFVVFANGNSYTYSPQMECWLVVAAKDPVLRHGLKTTMPKEFQRDYTSYPLLSVQGITTSFASGGSSSAIDLNTNDWQSSAKLSFIENQLRLCEAINSPEELKYWFEMLAYQLALSGSERQMRIFLNDLIADRTKIEHKILTVPKCELMEKVLSILKSHIKWQRIYMEYQQLYESWKNRRNSQSAAAENATNCAVLPIDSDAMETPT